jgi:hypothetical protein
VVVSPGAVADSPCQDGPCIGPQGFQCDGPSWTLQSPPTGPLAIVVSDASAKLEVDVADVGTPRTISVVSLANGASPSTPGKVTLAWSPASDAQNGQLWVGQVVFDGGSESEGGTWGWAWYSDEMVVQGPNASVDASDADPPSPSPMDGGPGIFSVSGTTSVAISRCDFPGCTTSVNASPSVAAVWQPY